MPASTTTPDRPAESEVDADGILAALATWPQIFDGDDTTLVKLRGSGGVSERDIAALADRMCNFFTRRSPFAFVNHPDNAEQRFIALWRGKLFCAAIHFAPDHLAEMRRALIQALRRKRRVVSDFGTGQLMSPADKARYEGGCHASAVGMGLDLPSPLKAALLIHWATPDRQPGSPNSDQSQG